MKTKSAAIWILMCGAALGVGAVAAYVERTPSLPHEPSPEASNPITTPSKPADSEPLVTPKAQQTVIVFVPSMGASGITFTKQEAPVPEGEDAKLVAINGFLKASQIAPADAKALSLAMQEPGSAAIVFNKAFDQTYGTFDEKKMLDGLAAAMGQFSEVNQFTLVVGDKHLTTLGSADLTNPIQVIRPDAVPTNLPSSSTPDEGAVKP